MSIQIPSDPKSRKVIADAVVEISNHLTQIAAFRDKIKEVLDNVKDKTGMKPKDMRKYANLKHKGKLSDAIAEADDLEALDQILTGGGE